eukprot:482245_1
MFTKWMLMQCLIFGTFGLDNFQCTEPGAVCSWNDKTSLQSAIQFVCAHKFELDAKQLLDWEMKLNRQEIDHLQDLLSLSDITFLHQLSHHVTTKLFECLYELREKNQLIEINVDNAFIESSAFPIDSINGIYIDARQEYNTEKIFIRMHSLDDVENANSVRFALFYTSDNTWAVNDYHDANIIIPHDHAWLRVNANHEWEYWSATQSKYIHYKGPELAKYL